MQARLQAENNPNLLVMHYDARRAAAADLIVVPKQFFTPEVIERRKPLAASARRAGCNILLGEVPDAGKVRLVREGVLTPKAEVPAGAAGRLSRSRWNAARAAPCGAALAPCRVCRG